MKTLTDIYGQTVDLDTRSVQELTINGQSKLFYFSPIANLPQQKWLVGLSLDKDMAYSSLNESRATAAIAILLIMVGVVGLLTLLMRSLMRPVTAMGAAMEDIADGDGDLTKRLIAHTSDEFGDLARSFNRFVQRVHDSIQDVQHVTHELNQVSRQVMTNKLPSYAAGCR
ncbi:methyl-accepting chemotaxis protein [Pseudomonas corrugata]